MGRLDSLTAPKLDTLVRNEINDKTLVVFDLKQLEYISSAGLRVFLYSYKALDNKGKIVVKNCCPVVKDVLDMTGFSSFITIE